MLLRLCSPGLFGTSTSSPSLIFEALVRNESFPSLKSTRTSLFIHGPWPSWQNHCVGDFFNVTNRLPTSQNCHQHTPSPTSVTNIDGNVHFTTGRCTRFCLYFTRKISIIELFLVSKTVPKLPRVIFWVIFKALYLKNCYLERKFPI